MKKILMGILKKIRSQRYTSTIDNFIHAKLASALADVSGVIGLYGSE